MLAGRIHSGCGAGTSGRASGGVAVPRGQSAQRSRVRLAALGQPPESPFTIKPGFFRVEDRNNREPDYADPDWFEKVTDWDEYWNYTRWDLEAEGMDDDYDAAGRPTRTLQRAAAMMSAMKAIEARPDVINVLPPINRRDHSHAWDDPPVDPEVQEELPAWDLNDWRAMAEKQKYKDLMDAEWRRRQAKVGKLHYISKDPIKDVRYRRFDDLGETFDWSHEEMYALITNNGTACKPEDHKAAVENPLAVVDMPNTMGVYYIEETEELLERLGHLGEVPAMQLLDDELISDLTKSTDMPPETVASLLLPQIAAMDEEEAEAEWKAEDGTWMGDL